MSHRDLALLSVLVLGALLPGCCPRPTEPATRPRVPARDAVVAPAPPAPRPALDPRTERMVTGLKPILDGLTAGKLSTDEAFERIRALEQVVGPPAVKLPPLVDACVMDADCALTDRALIGDSRYLCCDSLRRTAGTVAWVKQVEATCKRYEARRGVGPLKLPSCGIATGPISASTTRCRRGRCVACMEPNDGSPLLCHSPGL